MSHIHILFTLLIILNKVKKVAALHDTDSGAEEFGSSGTKPLTQSPQPKEEN